MSSLFGSTINTRYLPLSSFRYIRSDVPDNLNEAEVQWLITNKFLTIIDLRTIKEIEARPCTLRDRYEFRYLNIPITGGNSIPKCADEVYISYLKMVDKTIWEIIRTIEESKSNVFYFCSAGKDRTGVVSALLLSRIGATKEQIISDYVASAENLEELLKLYAMQDPTVNTDIITPKALYMEQFWDHVAL